MNVLSISKKALSRKAGRNAADCFWVWIARENEGWTKCRKVFSPSWIQNQGTLCSALHVTLILVLLRWNGFLIDKIKKVKIVSAWWKSIGKSFSGKQPKRFRHAFTSSWQVKIVLSLFEFRSNRFLTNFLSKQEIWRVCIFKNCNT